MPVARERLHRALNPRTVVVVGDKGPNYTWLTNQKQFTGSVYSVQVDEREIPGILERGYQNFRSIQEVPGDVDLVICAVPRQVSPIIVADAVKKGAAGMQMFTSGFAETGEPAAIDLQQRITDMARQSGLALVGPNCMGIYNRRLGVKFTADQPVGEGGTVSLISQSGTHGAGLVAGLSAAGVPVTRAISFGNAVVLNECDYLEYLLDDPDTSLIACYLEGTKDGRRLFDLLRRARGRKPVVIWRGGMTGAGARAIRSHTASLASSREVWNALIHQTGAIPVWSADEVIDTVSALVLAPRSRKRNVGLIAMTGGQSVAISDQFERAGLRVPELSKRSYERLAEFFVTVGGSYRNPFDAASTIREPGNMQKLLEILADEPAIDGGIAVELNTRNYDQDQKPLETTLEQLETFRQRTRLPVIALMPAGGVMGAGAGTEAAQRARAAIVGRGFPLYPSFQRGAEALGRLVGYYAELDEDGAKPARPTRGAAKRVAKSAAKGAAKRSVRRLGARRTTRR